MAPFITEYPQFFTATNLEWKKLLKPDKYKDIIISSLPFFLNSLVGLSARHKANTQDTTKVVQRFLEDKQRQKAAAKPPRQNCKIQAAD